MFSFGPRGRGGGDRGICDNVQGVELDDSAVVEQVVSVTLRVVDARRQLVAFLGVDLPRFGIFAVRFGDEANGLGADQVGEFDSGEGGRVGFMGEGDEGDLTDLQGGTREVVGPSNKMAEVNRDVGVKSEGGAGSMI